MTVDELRVLITAQTESMQKQIKVVQKQMGQLENTAKVTSGSIQKAFNAVSFTAIAYAVYKVTKSCTDAASDLVEVQNVVDTAFKQNSEIVDKWAKNVVAQYGMSETAAKRTASTFMAMSNGMNIATNSGTKMAITLAGLSADLASFWNTSQDEAFTALKSVYTGETETLKKYGVVMTEANLKAYALTLGIKKQYSEMSQAEKVALRYRFILSTTADAQGDFAKTSTSWANQIKILTTRFQQLKTAIGQILTTVLKPLLISLNKVLGVLVDIANTASVTITKIFGGEQKEIAIDTSKTTQSFEESNEAAENLKKTYKQLLGFDQLNLLSKPDNTSSGPSGDISSSLIDGDLIKEDSVLDKIDNLGNDITSRWEKFKKKWNFAPKFDGKAILAGIKQLRVQIKEIFKKYLPALFQTLIDWLNSIDFTLLAQMLINQLYAITAHLDKFFASFKKLWDTFFIGGINWDAIFASVITAIGNIINSVLDLVSTGVSLIGEVLADLLTSESLSMVKSSVITMLPVLFANLTTVVHQLIESFCKNILLFYQEGLSPIVEWIGTHFASLINNLASIFGNWQVLEGAMTFFDGWGSALAKVTSALWQVIKPIADASWIVFQNIVLTLAKLFVDIAAKIKLAGDSLALWLSQAENMETLKTVLATILSILTGIAAFKGGTALATFFTTAISSATTFTGVIKNLFAAIAGDSRLVQALAAIKTGLQATFGPATTAVLTAMRTAYSTTVTQIGASTSVFTTVKGVIAALGGGVKALWALFTANPIGLVIAAVAALAAAFVYLWTTSESFRTTMQTLWTEVLQPAFESLKESIAYLWEALQPLFELIGEFVKTVLMGLGDLLGEDGLAGVLGVLIQILTGVFGVAVEYAAGCIKTFAEYIKMVINGLREVIDFIVNVFTGNWGAAWDNLKEILRIAIEGMVNIAKSLLDTLVNTFKAAWEAIKSIFSEGEKETQASANKAQPKKRPKRQTAKIAESLSLQSYEITDVPKLAGGGVLYRTTIAEMGEYPDAKTNPEIVAPQSVIKQTVESANVAVVNAIYSIGNQISKSVNDKDTDVYMDGELVTKRITQKQKSQSRFGSSSLVMV